VKGLVYLLASSEKRVRAAASTALGEIGDRAAVRPLINLYVEQNDEEALEALSRLGTMVTAPVIRELDEPGLSPQRRRRLVRILGRTHDPAALEAVRNQANSDVLDVHTEACAALSLLGDRSGIVILGHDLVTADKDRRLMALRALDADGGDLARETILEHGARYIAEAGAVPSAMTVVAPRLADADADPLEYIAQRTRELTPNLVMIGGPGSYNLAQNRADDVRARLEGYDVVISDPALSLQDRIERLNSVRSTVAKNPGSRIVIVGRLPVPDELPRDEPYLGKPEAGDYEAYLAIVDPHEFNWTMDWWGKVGNTAGVRSTVDVLFTGRYGTEGFITEEEYILWRHLAPERKPEFARAVLAHL
jgi:hypothetical protein